MKKELIRISFFQSNFNEILPEQIEANKNQKQSFYSKQYITNIVPSKNRLKQAL